MPSRKRGRADFAVSVARAKAAAADAGLDVVLKPYGADAARLGRWLRKLLSGSDVGKEDGKKANES